ncbi:MAG: elongation factor P [Flavobacteriales bacterium]|nr:elongation factor P [Flavobacteriales bacterium]
MASTSDIKIGSVMRFNGELCIVSEKQHTMPGKGGAFYQVKMKSIQSGRNYENRFRSGESVDIARLMYNELQYIYEEGEHFVCMNQETYEQMMIPKKLFGENAKFLKESMIVKVGFESDQPIIAEAPTFVELLITRSEPGVKGDTATNSMKPATLETGAEIRVPLFVNEGEMIKIDTRTGEYVERVK